MGQAQAFRLAGFALAQAAWSVEDGEDLVPLGIAERDGTPSPSDEVDIPGAREGILLGVMSHPEGERLFPQLASFAREFTEASASEGAET